MVTRAASRNICHCSACARLPAHWRGCSATVHCKPRIASAWTAFHARFHSKAGASRGKVQPDRWMMTRAE